MDEKKNINKSNTWVNAPEETPDILGFVYIITEIDTGMIYIGKTKIWKIYKKKPTKYKMKDGKFLKDKKGKRILNTRTTREHIKKETKWRSYNSSSTIMQEKIEKNPSNYIKEIWSYGDTETILKLQEARLQLDFYFNGDWDLLYNEMINLRIRIRK